MCSEKSRKEEISFFLKFVNVIHTRSAFNYSLILTLLCIYNTRFIDQKRRKNVYLKFIYTAADTHSLQFFLSFFIFISTKFYANAISIQNINHTNYWV